MSEQMIAFDTESFLSKWGFGDGDMLDDLLWENGFEDPPQGFGHRVLEEVIRQKVLPEVKDELEVDIIQGIHNPVRALTVNGQGVRKFWYGDVGTDRMGNDIGEPPVIRPAVVPVPASKVLEIARLTLDSWVDEPEED